MNALPERLGKYEIVRVIGEGAMGVVYEAFDPLIRRALAIKTIRRELINGDTQVMSASARFRNEAQAGGRLMHPGIAAVYEYWEDERCACIAMEYVSGYTLREYIARRTRFAEEDVLSIMGQLLDALGHAHSHGVWHRDIKPANLIVTREGRLKVADFGVARIEAAGLTLDGSMIGTPGYMAPEQYTGDPIDGRVDLYASGVVMYQLIAGRLPFSGSAEAIMYKTVSEVPAPPSSQEGAARYQRYDEVVLRALAKHPQDRYASAELFRQALVEISHQPLTHAVSEDTLIMEPARADPAGQLGATGTPGEGAGSRLPRPRAADGEPTKPSRPDADTGQRSQTFGSAAPTQLESWDPALLAEVEARLSRHMGPVARVLVRRAAARCSDFATLTNLLADHIPEAAERGQFLTATMAGASGTRAGTAASARTATQATAGVRSHDTAPENTASDSPISPAFLSHATRTLAARIGPIARVLVEKVTRDGDGRRAFAQALVKSAGEVDDPDRLLSDILAGPR